MVVGSAAGQVDVDYRGYSVDGRFPGKDEPAGISETRFLHSDTTTRLTLAVGGRCSRRGRPSNRLHRVPSNEHLGRPDASGARRPGGRSDALYLEILDFAQDWTRMGRKSYTGVPRIG